MIKNFSKTTRVTQNIRNMSGFQPRDLIREVKCRPPIFNREIIAPPRRDHVRRLWLEVAENLTPAEDWEQYTDVEKDARVDELQLKWKHLKNHFHRELKLIDAGEAHKKRKYIYFDDMEFMRPFVGYTLAPLRFDKHPNQSIDSVDESMQADNAENNSDIDMEALLKTGGIIEEVEETEETEETVAETSIQRPKRNIKPTPKSIQKPIQKPSSTPKVQKQVVLKKSTPSASKGSSTPVGNNASFKIRDGDISFTLSLVPTLRKLGDSKKLRAKIEILKVLHKFAGTAEQSHYLNRSTAQNNNSTKNEENDEDSDMQEDHLEEFEDGGGGVNVKNEDNDPLNGNKTWWT